MGRAEATVMMPRRSKARAAKTLAEHRTRDNGADHAAGGEERGGEDEAAQAARLACGLRHGCRKWFGGGHARLLWVIIDHTQIRSRRFRWNVANVKLCEAHQADEDLQASTL